MKRIYLVSILLILLKKPLKKTILLKKFKLSPIKKEINLKLKLKILIMNYFLFKVIHVVGINIIA